MRRFEVTAAWIMGFALPTLEAARRRTHFHPFASYIDDFIAGALLLWAAYAASHRHPSGRALLCAAWGILTGGMYTSFFGQLERGNSMDISGVHGGYVIAVKGLLFLVAIVCLALSVRRTSEAT